MTLNPRQETNVGVFWLPLESWSLLGFRKANVQFTFKSLEIGKCSHFCLHNVWFYLQFHSGSLRCHPCSPKKFPSRNSVGKMGGGAGYAGEGRKACLPALVQLNKSFKGILIQALDQNDSFLSCSPYCFIYEIHINLGEWFRTSIFFFFLKMLRVSISRYTGASICWTVISASLKGVLPGSHLHAVSFSRCVCRVGVKLPAALKWLMTL